LRASQTSTHTPAGEQRRGHVALRRQRRAARAAGARAQRPRRAGPLQRVALPGHAAARRLPPAAGAGLGVARGWARVRLVRHRRAGRGRALAVPARRALAGRRDRHRRRGARMGGLRPRDVQPLPHRAQPLRDCARRLGRSQLLGVAAGVGAARPGHVLRVILVGALVAAFVLDEQAYCRAHAARFGDRPRIELRRALHALHERRLGLALEASRLDRRLAALALAPAATSRRRRPWPAGGCC
jgi:hypothetical protein